jgi:hypothetical protein
MKNRSDIKKEQKKLFGEIKTNFLDYDPAHFIQNNLTLDGEPFSVLGNGWKFMADIYRYIALQASRKNGKPVIIKKGRQVGATMMAGALDLYFTNSGLFTSPPIRVAHLFPALALVKRFTQDKLESLIRDAKDDFINQNKLPGNNAVDNLTMKQFNTGTLWIESIGADGDRVRGMTLDVAFYDEVQDMVQLAIGNSTKTLTAAKYGQNGKGVQVYFGTPKEKGSWFETTWQMSDQRYYHLGCGNCEQTYPFYMPEDDGWKDIWISGYDMKCPLCGAISKKLDAIERGRWVASKNSDDCKYVGFHINQLYIPNLNREYINDLMPENNPNQSERVWNNEVVGEFYAGVGMPLTRQHIELYCKDQDRAFSRSIHPRDKKTYLGVDWGDKTEKDSSGQSYSCTVVLSDAGTGDGTLLIEHAHKLRERSFDYKKSTINEMYRRFGIKQGVSDFFFGQDVVRSVQSGMGDRFLGAQGSGALLNPVKYREDELMITYNKDLMIEELFEKIKKGKIRFPWKSYEYVEWLIDHCTSMGTSLRTRGGGQQVKTYVKGSTPNDGLMALLYAYMAWKFDSTERFTIKPGRKMQSAMPKPSLAYAPRLKV